MVGRPKKRAIGFKYSTGNSYGGRRGTAVIKGGITRKRLSTDLCALALKNTGIKNAVNLPGITLRPKPKVEDNSDFVPNSNDIIDIQLQQTSYQDAHKNHRLYANKQKSTKHVPTLLMKKTANLGFGVKVRYACRRCSFVSDEYDLFTSTSSGACSTNVLSGVAFSKTCIKPSDAEFLFQTLNVSCPSRNTMQKHFSRSNDTCADVLEDTLADNRGFVRDYMDVTSPTSPPPSPPPPPPPPPPLPPPSSSQALPTVSSPQPSTSTQSQGRKVTLSSDGQYNRPTFHGYDGKATSVSQPFLEEETDLHLLNAYVVVSKKDGSYPKDKVTYLSPLVISCVKIGGLYIVC